MTGIPLTLLLLCTAGLQALSITYTPKEICVLKGTKVRLRCTYTLPAGHIFKAGHWYKRDSWEQPPSSVSDGTHFQYNHLSPPCLLWIHNLTPRDSGSYEYRVTTQRNTVLTGPGRAAVRVVATAQKDCWGVSYSSTSFCALRGSTLDIPCTYGHPRDLTVTATAWYKEVEKGKGPLYLRLDEQYQGRVEDRGTENNCTLRIRDVRQTDSGQYTFRYTTDTQGGAFSGDPVKVAVTGLHVSMTAGTVTEGGRVTLSCNTKCNLRGNTTFIWYKNTQPTRHTAISNTLHLNPVSSEDTGNYSCALNGHKEHPSPEATLDVRYAPRKTTALVAPPAEIVGDNLMTLTCSSDANPPVHNYTWYMKRGTKISPLGAGQSFIAANINNDTSGLYFCVARNSVGAQNSTVVSVPIVGQSSAKNAAIGVLVVVVAVLLILVLLWLRKRKSGPPSNKGSTSTPQQADPDLVYDDVSAVAVNSDPARGRNTETDDDVQYSVIQFKGSKEAEVAPRAQTAQEDVQSPYASVQSPRAQTAQKDVQSPYASVQSPRGKTAQEDVQSPYASVQSPRGKTAQEDVQYAAVNFSTPKDTSQVEADQVIYSTVNKPPKTRMR